MDERGIRIVKGIGFGAILLTAVLPWKIVTWDATRRDGSREEGFCGAWTFLRTPGPCEMRNHLAGSFTALATTLGAGALHWESYRRVHRALKVKGTPAYHRRALEVMGFVGAALIAVIMGCLLANYFFGTDTSGYAPEGGYQSFGTDHYGGLGGVLLPLSFAAPLIALKARAPLPDAPWPQQGAAAGDPSFSRYRG